MKKVKSALLIGIALLVLFLAGGFLLPAHWKVERSILINAPPSAIYPLVANFKAGWPQWSSFDHEDPGIQYSYSGPDEGVGATRNWVSKKMGNGFQKILKADPASGVQFELEMEQNHFHIDGLISFQNEGAGTHVTWTDSGEAGPNPIYRYMCALMDKMMGQTFEKSLATLKTHAEAAASK